MDFLDKHDVLILQYLEWHWNSRGASPSYGDVAKHTNVNSKDHIFRDLERLEGLGYVLLGHKARSIILLRTSDGAPYHKDLVEISILGCIAAGEPIPFPESGAEPVGSVMVPRSLGLNAKDTYALKVQGDSMIDVFIDDGDLVFIRHQTTANDGDLVAARLYKDPTNPKTTLKCFRRQGKRIWLQPKNRKYKRIPIKRGQLEIQGIVMHVWRDMHANFADFQH